MNYCKRCLYPDTKPQLVFDENGICSACKNHELKEKIDWKSKEKELKEILEKFRSKNNYYDCIIPVSGGKDSTYQVHFIKNVIGLKPLCVTFEPTLPTKIGRKNLDMLNRLGVDLIHFKLIINHLFNFFPLLFLDFADSFHFLFKHR